MAILVDEAVWPWRGRLWAHLTSDVSMRELHAFAERLEIPRRGFGGDHYDVPEEYVDRCRRGRRRRSSRAASSSPG